MQYAATGVRGDVWYHEDGLYLGLHHEKGEGPDGDLASESHVGCGDAGWEYVDTDV